MSVLAAVGALPPEPKRPVDVADELNAADLDQALGERRMPSIEAS